MLPNGLLLENKKGQKMSTYKYKKKTLKNQKTHFREKKKSGLGVSSDDKGNGINMMNKLLLGRYWYIYFI